MSPPITEVTDPRYFETLGRRFYYIFVPMPLILVFALLHLRIWAVILFLLLAISPQLLKAFWVINHPTTFFASNLQDLNNASAVDPGFIRFNAVVCSVAICAMFGLLFFNNYAIAAAQRIERTNALLGRYFAPEVRKEIETLEMDPTKQDSKEQDCCDHVYRHRWLHKYFRKDASKRGNATLVWVSDANGRCDFCQ